MSEVKKQAPKTRDPVTSLNDRAIDWMGVLMILLTAGCLIAITIFVMVHNAH